MFNKNLALYNCLISEDLHIQHRGKYIVNVDAIKNGFDFIVSAYVYAFPYMICGFNRRPMNSHEIRKFIMSIINEISSNGDDWGELKYLLYLRY